ncbi:pentapeptide repeat-containing protein, partial [Thalassospira sp.]|uniref:pentapeptide repeat-containing protein n=1 Tax=Thalassospira sp. TaxID=1912094 RepID=UPI001B220D24
GNVDFSYANFGDGNVNFSEATFGAGNLDFSRAKFGSGKVDFSKANFRDGNVTFFLANFGDGEVDFYGATFGDGNVDFSDATFGDGNVDFLGTTFGDGNVNFFAATFGDGNVNFTEANFGAGNLDFYAANFGDGNVNFDLVTLCDGSVIFTEAKLATLYFNPTTIGACRIEAEDLSIKNRAVFEFPLSAEALTFLSLQGASFDGPLRLSGNIGTIPDLRATRSTHQVDLSALKVNLRRVWQWRSWPPKLSPVAEDPKDGAKSGRLKEIAETNRDHHAALRFSADENRARRWRETSWLGSVLDMAFSVCSDYGQNILRPLAALLIFTVVFTLLYKAMKTPVSADVGSMWEEALLLSVSNSVPFLPQSSILRTDAIDVLYCGTPSLAVYAIMIAQGVFSFIFLFLVGLGLRNRFRL